MSDPKKTISVIIPCYESEAYLGRTVEELIDAFHSRSDYACQLILVNDCSKDGTFDVIRSLIRETGAVSGSPVIPESLIGSSIIKNADIITGSPICGINLPANLGQTKAKLIGQHFAAGDYVVFMDDDGQHSPKDLFRLVGKIDEGYDLVYAQFPKLKEVWWRAFASRLTDIVLSAAARKPVGISITSFYALSKGACEYINTLEAYHGLACQNLAPYSKKIGGITVKKRARREDHSRYTLKKLIKMWFGLVFGKKFTL